MLLQRVLFGRELCELCDEQSLRAVQQCDFFRCARCSNAIFLACCLYASVLQDASPGISPVPPQPAIETLKVEKYFDRKAVDYRRVASQDQASRGLSPIETWPSYLGGSQTPRRDTRHRWQR